MFYRKMFLEMKRNSKKKMKWEENQKDKVELEHKRRKEREFGGKTVWMMRFYMEFILEKLIQLTFSSASVKLN